MVLRPGWSGRRLSESERLDALDLVACGLTLEGVAAEIDTTKATIVRLLRARGRPPRRSRRRQRSRLRLSLREREEIRAGIAAGDSLRRIAARLGRAPSTVSREVAANGGREGYLATRAEGRAVCLARRPRRSKLALSPQLRVEVRKLLKQRFSPEQIAGHLKLRYPDDLEMRISHETIYQSLYVQSRGQFRKDLTRYLRTQRNTRKPRRGTPLKHGQIPGMISISERPAEIEDRAVPGHWEGDLLVGKKNGSFIGTLVERQTRFVMLIYLGQDSRTLTVTEAIAAKITELPKQLRRSLTWDRGKEMSGHLNFTIKTGIDVYFCDPHSPWQRGSNENTNGLLRQYFPKGTDLAVHGQVELNRVAAELNKRPRQTLDWHTPAEKMHELLLR